MTVIPFHQRMATNREAEYQERLNRAEAVIRFYDRQCRWERRWKAGKKAVAYGALIGLTVLFLRWVI